MRADVQQVPNKVNNAFVTREAPKKSSKSVRKTILLSPDRILDGYKDLRGPKKVYFNIPKEDKKWWKFEPMDPRSSFIQGWLMFMLFPLGYEVWAFPYRLALGVPSLSTQMQLTLADFACDMIFCLDMVVSLSTILPKAPGRDEAVTSFLGISRHYFRNTFPIQILPSFPFWISTFIVTNHLQEWSVCGRKSELNGLYLNFSCIVENQEWEVVLWWLTSLIRVLPRLVRLVLDFKAMESNLVRLRAPCESRTRPDSIRSQEVTVRELQMIKFAMIIFLAGHWVHLKSLDASSSCER